MLKKLNHTVCNIPGLPFSLSVIPWSPTRLLCVNSLFLFIAEQYSMYVCTLHGLAFYLLKDIWVVPVLGYCKQCCYEHVSTGLGANMFSSLWDKCIRVSFLGHTVDVCLVLEETDKLFQSGCTIFYSYQQYMSDLIFFIALPARMFSLF